MKNVLAENMLRFGTKNLTELQLNNILHEQIDGLDYTQYTQLELLNINASTFATALNVMTKQIQAGIAQANAGKTGYQLQQLPGPITPPWPNNIKLTVTPKETTVPESIGGTSQTANVPALKWSLQCNGKPMELSNRVTTGGYLTKSRIYGRGISDAEIQAFQKSGATGGEKINIKSGMNYVDEAIGSGQFDKYMQVKMRQAMVGLLNPSHYSIVAAVIGKMPEASSPRAKQFRAVNNAISNAVRTPEYRKIVQAAGVASYQKQVNKFKQVNAKNIANRQQAYGVTSRTGQ